MNVPCLGVLVNDEAGDYLATVRREAAAMPRIIVAQDNNISLPLVPDIPRTTKGGGGNFGSFAVYRKTGNKAR